MTTPITSKGIPTQGPSIEQLQQRLVSSAKDLTSIFKAAYLRAPEHFELHSRNIENIVRKCSGEKEDGYMEFTHKDLRFLVSEVSFNYLLKIPRRIVNEQQRQGAVDIYGNPTINYTTILNGDIVWIIRNIRLDQISLKRLLIEVISQPFKDITNTPTNTPQSTPPSSPLKKSPISSPQKGDLNLSRVSRACEHVLNPPSPISAKNLFIR